MLIKNMMEDLGDEAISTAVPIPNVGSLKLLDFSLPSGAPLQRTLVSNTSLPRSTSQS